MASLEEARSGVGAGGAEEWVFAGPLEDLRRQGLVVVTAGRSRVAVIHEAGRVWAVDNRCPHMGFPLDRGSVADGILTCHWHQARFDLRSGCTFDLFADDVACYETRVEDGGVWVASRPRQERDAAYHGRRLRRGIEQNVPLVQAKSLLGLLEHSAFDDVVAEAGRYAADNLTAMSEGMVRLACVANLRAFLSPETTYQALFYAVRQIAAEAVGAVPRRRRDPLDSDQHDLATLRRWLAQWVRTRHSDATERTLLTALERQGPDALAELLYGAAAERLFANTGHLFDFGNKALELARHLGPDGPRRILPLLTLSLTQVRGEEESTAWHHPIELVEPLRALEKELPALVSSGSGTAPARETDLDAVLLGDDPIAILDALKRALAGGVAPERLAARVAYCAALRMARFATSNEVTDWFDVQHTLNFASAVHRAVRRCPVPEVVRAVFHGAIAVYMDRYLNVPPARLPSEQPDGRLPGDASVLRQLLLDTLDQRSELDAAAAIVSRYLALGHPLGGLVDTLTLATVREDLDFHTLQNLEAAVSLCEAYKGGPEVEPILVGVVRGLAAHCPTRRAGQQTARIALRLHRGDAVYEDEAAGP